MNKENIIYVVVSTISLIGGFLVGTFVRVPYTSDVVNLFIILLISGILGGVIGLFSMLVSKVFRTSDRDIINE